jgi:hypothetical protein
MAKITKATFKSFIKKNENLHIRTFSEFDGMVDGCVAIDTGFKPITMSDRPHTNNLGIQGVWLVGQSRDYFREYNKDGYKGIEVSNCCGNFVIAVKV